MRYPTKGLSQEKVKDLKAIGDRHKSQSDKFKDLAREVEADEDEAAFDRKLKRLKGRQASGEDHDVTSENC